MTNKHIIYIPGKNPKPQPEQHKELLWKTMTEGIRRADENIAKVLQGQIGQFHLISWNYLFYNTYKDITPDIPWIDTLINKHGPSVDDIHEANSWRARLGRILFTLADHMHFLIPLLPREVASAAKEMNNYFNNMDNIACDIRALVKKTLRPFIEKNEPVLIIGHSLGSIIAYDTLWELTYEEKLQGKIDLLTIGSPLGANTQICRAAGFSTSGLSLSGFDASILTGGKDSMAVDSRSVMNASQRPSGDHCAAPAELRPRVSWILRPVATSASHNCQMNSSSFQLVSRLR